MTTKQTSITTVFASSIVAVGSSAAALYWYNNHSKKQSQIDDNKEKKVETSLSQLLIRQQEYISFSSSGVKNILLLRSPRSLIARSSKKQAFAPWWRNASVIPQDKESFLDSFTNNFNPIEAQACTNVTNATSSSAPQTSRVVPRPLELSNITTVPLEETSAVVSPISTSPTSIIPSPNVEDNRDSLFEDRLSPKSLTSSCTADTMLLINASASSASDDHKDDDDEEETWSAVSEWSSSSSRRPRRNVFSSCVVKKYRVSDANQLPPPPVPEHVGI